MTKVIGVRFRPAGKIYFFAPGRLNISNGDKVIVETARGVEFGSVVVGEKEVEDERIMLPLKPVIRIATEEDIKKEEKNREQLNICRKRNGNRFTCCLHIILIKAKQTYDTGNYNRNIRV